MKIRLPRPALLIFAVGFFLLLTLVFNLLIAAQEANLFDADYRGEAKLESLRCPRLMSRDEVVRIRLTVDNPTDTPLTQFLRLNVSRGNMLSMQEYTERIDLAAGESYVQEWSLTAEAPVYGRFVLLRAHVPLNRAYHYRQAPCGIVVVPLRCISGVFILWLVSGLGLFWILSGAGLFFVRQRPLNGYDGKIFGILIALGLLTLLDWLLAMQGNWLFGLLLLLLIGLVLLVGLGQIFLTETHANS
jgi:hypothetical protein